jgi:hypothetical protein
MKAEIPLLQAVRVAAPCHASWDAMTEVEGDRVKFCSGCQKRVYNLSAMGQAEAEGLLRRHEGKLCVRYYRRRDGTILTAECPVGLRAARELAFRRAQASFALCALFCAALAAYRVGADNPGLPATCSDTGISVAGCGTPNNWPIGNPGMSTIEEKPVQVEVEQSGVRVGEVIRWNPVRKPIEETSIPAVELGDVSSETREEIEGIRKTSVSSEHQ